MTALPTESEWVTVAWAPPGKSTELSRASLALST